MSSDLNDHFGGQAVPPQVDAERTIPADTGRTVLVSTPNDPHAIHAVEAQVAAEWKVGDVILDLYEVKHVFEGGGMGLVYRVHHRGWNTDLAVKSPRSDYFKTEAQKENFTRECETWINLGLHPHVVSCHYVRTLGGIPRVFAEYVEGGTLKEWIDSRKLYEGGEQESLKRILDIAIQMAWGLHYAHEQGQGLVHQDVKPANVLMIPDGTAKITDFGLAKARAASGVPVATGAERSILVSSGGMTPAYCSPEQANKQALSRKTDIWSWAVSVLEMFVGEVCWQSGTAVPAVLKQLSELRAEGAGLPEMPEDLRELLQVCFESNPAKRPKDASEVSRRLVGIYVSQLNVDFARPEPAAAELRADGLNNRGLSLLDLGRGPEAEALWDEALRAEPSHLEATYNRGLHLWRSGRLADDVLVRDLEDMKRQSVDDWRRAWLLAQVHTERGDAESAIRALEVALQDCGNDQQLLAALPKARARVQERWGRCLQTFQERTGGDRVPPLAPDNLQVLSVAISPDGRWGLSGSTDKTLRLWDLSTGDCLRTFKGQGVVTSLAITPDGRHGLSGSTDGTLRLWDLSTGDCLRTLEGLPWADRIKAFLTTGDNYCVRSVAISSDGRWCLSGDSKLPPRYEVGIYINPKYANLSSQPISVRPDLRLWDLSTGECLRTFGGHEATNDALGNYAVSVESVAISPDGRWGLSGSDDNTLRLWDFATGTLLRTFEGHTGCVHSVACSPNGCWGLSASGDKTLRLWDLSTGACLRTFVGHTANVNSVAISRDGRLGVSGGGDKTLRLWELSTGACLRTFEGHKAAVLSVAISPEGCRALSGGADNGLRLWDLAVGVAASHVVTRPRDHMEISRHATIFAEKLAVARAALVGGDGTNALRMVDEARKVPGYAQSRAALDLRAQVGAFGARSALSSAWCLRTLEGHTNDVNSVALSADGRWALSGSWGQLRLWELPKGKCLRTFEGHSVSIRSIAISADGRWGLSQSKYNSELVLWDLCTGECLRHLNGHKGTVVAAAISLDGRWGLSADEGGSLCLWNLSTGACLRTLVVGLKGWQHFTAISTDWRWCLSGRKDDPMRLWELFTGTCLRTFEECAPPSSNDSMRLSANDPPATYSMETCVTLSADGQWALSASKDRALRLWEVATGHSVRTLVGHTGKVNSVAISPDGRCGLSGSRDKTVRLWDLSTGKCLQILVGHTEDVNSVAISADGRWGLSGSSDKTLRLWEFAWDFEFPAAAVWDERALPHLNTFLTLHSPCGADGFTRVGRPVWTDVDFQKLLTDLQNCGYGWLRPESVRRRLEKMTTEWQGPPPMPWEQVK